MHDMPKCHTIEINSIARYLEQGHKHVVLFPIWLNMMDPQNTIDAPKYNLVLLQEIFLYLQQQSRPTFIFVYTPKFPPKMNGTKKKKYQKKTHTQKQQQQRNESAHRATSYELPELLMQALINRFRKHR